MNNQTISLVQESFKKLAPKADEVGMMFYDRLFETYPDVRPMFAPDIRPQSRKLVQMLAVVVGGLQNLDSILPAVKELARRHHGYGVLDAHYAAVGSTLIWTLHRSLGEAFTKEVERAWHDAFAALSAVMIEASREARPA